MMIVPPWKRFNSSIRFIGKFGLILLATIFLFSFPFPATAYTEKQAKKVLLLFPEGRGVLYQTLTEKGIRAAFDTAKEFRIEYFIEFMDITRYEDQTYYERLLDLYRYKYADKAIDLLIPTVYLPVKWVADHGDKLFPQTPVVFASTLEEQVKSMNLTSKFTGVLADIDFPGLLETAINLHPQTRHVTVINGSTPYALFFEQEFRQEYESYANRFKFIYLTNLTFDQIMNQVPNLPEHTVIIFCILFKDAEGKLFIPQEALRMVSDAANAPIYSLLDTFLGHGMVGGLVYSNVDAGIKAGEMGLRIFRGEKPSDIPMSSQGTKVHMFDWRELKRWDISEDRLPPGSIVKFKELTTWDRYKGRIITAIAMILIQALIISYLLYQRRIRRKVEQNYRTVADYTYDWEYWQNPDGSMQYISPSCERICGYSAQDLKSNPALFQDMILAEDKAVWDEHKHSVQKDTMPEEIQFRIQRPDGEIRWIEHVCQPVFDDQGNNQGVRASNRDITKRVFYRSETHKLQSELAHMDRVVTISTLTSALAHEINQPLAAMRSYAQAAIRFMDKEHPEYDSVQKALQGIIADNKRAAEVVNRLRDLVKKGPAHWENVDINSIINDVISLINSELVLRNTSITLDLNSDISVIQGDLIQIQQVLINLLTNALDAMDDQPIGKRKITLSTKPENLNEIIVSISDSGGGIPPGTIEAIFSPFHTTKSTGIGLGLSISKSIIEAHGGKISAENNSDGGATFYFILPAGSQIR